MSFSGGLNGLRDRLSKAVPGHPDQYASAPDACLLSPQLAEERNCGMCEYVSVCMSGERYLSYRRKLRSRCGGLACKTLCGKGGDRQTGYRGWRDFRNNPMRWGLSLFCFTELQAQAH